MLKRVYMRYEIQQVLLLRAVKNLHASKPNLGTIMYNTVLESLPDNYLGMLSAQAKPPAFV